MWQVWGHPNLPRLFFHCVLFCVNIAFIFILFFSCACICYVFSIKRLDYVEHVILKTLFLVSESLKDNKKSRFWS